jgi:hypothetical protein
MAKRWTRREDEMLHAYFDEVGELVGMHDLGRPRGAATKRVKALKANGAWAALDREREARRDYRRCLGLPCMEDEEQVPA